MRRILIGGLAAALVCAALAPTALAAGRCHGGGGGYCYVDADGDGVCDNRGAGCWYADADGDGVCDHYALRDGTGARHGGGHGWRSCR